ncbi:Gamma-glutamyltranspeptidase precursor [Legionella massiliensis]|uniref:Glutathione hydrolase proenzyme n=1 Tax=Legionella massiliensis TaxID=1034943 RepID=A0A078KRZ5_9GAMM|nr:gamma-glutamyltransferase [Legionella massiliensis]CDZ75866.1 Gamma-glutamyltranspeptidase precursor [Legionella massiliensis]CEE11604.1 Gamma-glutamyltranspeptidase precursor [Legionella massiliensis]
MRAWKYLVIILCFGVGSLNATQYAEKPSGYAVASAHPLATNAGLETLAKGGNAFDAAVAVSAALAVVAPYHSGLGGGGFWLLHLENDKKNIFIDGREAAPLAAHKNMFLGKDGQVVPGLSLNGGLAAAIPGEPAALAYIAKHYGRLPLTESLAPAIRLAEEGFVVDQLFNYYSTISDRLQMLQRFPDTAAVFLKEGKAYQIGQRLKQPELAKTLRLFAEKGHDGFYHGEIAERLVKGVRAAGGVWTLDDLAQYQIKLREPLEGAFHNMLIVTAPPPSAGGVGLLTMLNILADYPLQTLTKAKWVHYVVEAMRLAYWQRSKFLADPDFVKIPLNILLSAENAKQLRQLILSDKALPSTSLQGDAAKLESDNTTQLSILDSEGNRVSATMTVNFIFGSSVMPAGTGIVLNDEMDDFSTKPGERNVYGVVGSDVNTIQPGKRPLSSMTPTFLETPGRVAIFGTPGGSRIPTMVLLAALDFHNYGGAISMVSTMRFHHQYLPDWIQVEPDTFSPSLQAELKAMGYKLMMLNQYYGDMQAITWDKESNLVTAASDPRHIGLAATISVNQRSYDSFNLQKKN